LLRVCAVFIALTKPRGVTLRLNLFLAKSVCMTYYQ